VRQHGQHPAGIVATAEFLDQARPEALSQAGPQQEVTDPGRLGVEHLGEEVLGDIGPIAAEPVDDRVAVRRCCTDTAASRRSAAHPSMRSIRAMLEADGGMQDPVAQGLGFGFGEVTVEGEQLQPGEQLNGDRDSGAPRGVDRELA
jgi:hypothetical protein